MFTRIFRVAVMFAVVGFAAAAAKAPDFNLPTGAGSQLSLASLRGHRVVISFYASYY